MYYCQIMKRFSAPNEKLNKIVIEIRERTYTKQLPNEDTGALETVEVGRGWEIVKEINASDMGVIKYNAMSKEQQQALINTL
jgi:hypothetical protein